MRLTIILLSVSFIIFKLCNIQFKKDIVLWKTMTDERRKLLSIMTVYNSICDIVFASFTKWLNKIYLVRTDITRNISWNVNILVQNICLCIIFLKLLSLHKSLNCAWIRIYNVKINLFIEIETGSYENPGV